MRRSPYHCFCTVHCRARVGEPNERGESSPLRSATRTCTSACAPASDQRIWRFLAIRVGVDAKLTHGADFRCPTDDL